jgi:hypothetical protein
MENYTPEWRIHGELAAAGGRARLIMVNAYEVRRAAIECRRRAAVLCEEAQRLRAESLRHRIRG